LSMKWVRDTSGRFPQRPHYLPGEMDAECEHLLTAFLERHCGKIVYPISTESLTVLIEGMAEDLDLYADLSREGDVEGVTDFFAGGRPRVRISRLLSGAAHMENRLRTTLTHEAGHVKFHGFMFEVDVGRQSLFPPSRPSHTNRCKREQIIGAARGDWMEWQAGYACGALLMPISALRETVRDFLRERGLATAKCALDTEEGQELVSRAVGRFMVSRDAARVRLFQAGALVESTAFLPARLFS
jgi:hypothetical protein